MSELTNECIKNLEVNNEKNDYLIHQVIKIIKSEKNTQYISCLK